MAKKGKYEDLCKTLPNLPEETSYQQKVNAVKEQMLATWNDPAGFPTSGKLALEYRQLRDEKDTHEDELKACQLRLTAIEQMLAERYENDGIKSCVLDDGALVSVGREPHAVVVDQAAVRRWAIENDLESKLTIPWTSLNALVKELRIDGLPDPDGVRVFSRAKFTLRR